jgi:ABC-type Fe3+-citrate transport system substrate-binding protein
VFEFVSKFKYKIKVDTNENFVFWNTEEFIKLDPDIILLTEHGLEDLAMEMFNKEFSANGVWKNFGVFLSLYCTKLPIYTIDGKLCIMAV